MAAAKRSHHREYFDPAEVPDDLSLSTRRCAPACCAFLGLPPPPSGANPTWSYILQRISPQDYIIRSFDNLDIIKHHLDNLFVATMNKGGVAGAGHSAVLFRGEDQMGSTKCHLFNPGRSTPLGQVDLSKQRGTKGWNYVCAAFIPGTNIPTNATDIITVVDSSDDDNNSHASSPIARSRSGSAVASASRPSPSLATSPTSSRNGSTQSAHSRGMPSSVRGGGTTVAFDIGSNGDAGTPRRTPSRATKRCKSMTSLFYKESLQVIGIAQQDYSRVMEYTCYDYDQLLPKEFSREMIGQHVAKYLHDEGQGWVNWFHHESSQFVIARKKSFSGYDIEGAEEGKDRFIGYAALAEWAFREGIYQKSIKTADGKAFLDEVGLEEDDLNKLFKSITITARKRKQKINSTGNAANVKKKKKHNGVDMAKALRNQLVAEFEEEEERIASEANAAKLSATKDTSPSPSDHERSSESSEEESSFGGDNYDEDDGDDDEDWKDDETEQQAKVSNPKQVSTKSKSAQQEPSPSQENDGDVSDVSNLEDDVSGSGVAQSSQQEQEEGEGRDMSAAGVGNQAMVSEIEELRAEVYAKSQAEAKLNTKSDELEAVQNEGHRLHNEINDLKADAKSLAEETGTDQDQLRRLRNEIETKNEENSRLQRELTAAATTAQEHIPDYIVKPRDICDDRVAFGSEDEGKAIILQQVSEALSNRDGRTIELAKRWSDAGKSPEEIVEGLYRSLGPVNKGISTRKELGTGVKVLPPLSIRSLRPPLLCNVA
eukprot:scaffold1532_cov111-Skeletonema_dohrnii-CCMP3373.AAC.3